MIFRYARLGDFEARQLWRRAAASAGCMGRSSVSARRDPNAVRVEIQSAPLPFESETTTVGGFPSALLFQPTLSAIPGHHWCQAHAHLLRAALPTPALRSP